jgi:hypothetical protein
MSSGFALRITGFFSTGPQPLPSGQIHHPAQPTFPAMDLATVLLQLGVVMGLESSLPFDSQFSNFGLDGSLA